MCSISVGNLKYLMTSWISSLCFKTFLAFIVLTTAASIYNFLSFKTLSCLASASIRLSFFYSWLIYILLIFDLNSLFNSNLSNFVMFFTIVFLFCITIGRPSTFCYFYIYSVFFYSSTIFNTGCSGMQREINCFFNS